MRGLDDHGLSQRCFVFGVGQVAQRMHASEHVALTQDGARLVGDRVKARRRFGDARQECGIGRSDFRELFAQISARGCRKAVSSMTQINLIKIELENLVFGQTGLDFEGEQQLIKLT